jgi:AraC family transcriptional regulator
MQTISSHIDSMTEAPFVQQPLAFEAGQHIPGSVEYTVRRFVRPEDWMMEDRGAIHYHMDPSNPEKNHLELRFCVAGNMYCRQYNDDCRCKTHHSSSCDQKLQSVDIFSFSFTSTLLEQFVGNRNSHSLSDDILSFRHEVSFVKPLPVCNKTRVVLEGIANNTYTDTLGNIYVNAQTQMLLLYSMDCLLGEKEINTITCKFLANEADRDKIIKAREVLIQHIGEPITIKELSRKVAMNECYLKKGFKEMFGTTIFEFYQSQRMEHAKYLLYEKGLSVTEVSVLLGYSSISHFSTAFKKHTGLKPCELLLR